MNRNKLRTRLAKRICSAMGDDWYREGPKGLMEAYGPAADAVLDGLSSVRDALDQRYKLLQAIQRHRDDIWGSGPIGHPEDAELYRVAGLPDIVESDGRVVVFNR